MGDTVIEETIQAAARVLARTALNVIYNDPHQWSTRRCQTCRSVTEIIGEPFGCDRYRISREGKRS